MNDVVLDSSAVLAFLFGEPGGEDVAALLPHAILSTVNLAEIISRLCERMTFSAACAAVELTGARVIEFDVEQAYLAGDLRKITRSAGLSLGDRACLALARLKNLPAVTADTTWKSIEGFDVVLIRGGSQ